MKQSISPSYLEKGYGQFPYIIRRITSAFYQQIPLHSEELKSLNLDGIYVSNQLLKEVVSYELACDITFIDHWDSEKDNGNSFEMCLVTNKNRAMFIDKNGEITISDEIPSGGILVSIDNEVIQINSEHYVYEF